jgi:hypothetical protein
MFSLHKSQRNKLKKVCNTLLRVAYKRVFLLMLPKNVENRHICNSVSTLHNNFPGWFFNFLIFCFFVVRSIFDTF